MLFNSNPNSLFTNETIKKKISIPLITSIYYDDKVKTKPNYLNDLRISYESKENELNQKKDELLKDFLKGSNSVNLAPENYKCETDENDGKKYCLKCHIWLCENCLKEHKENKPLHPLSNNEINLIDTCSQHLKNLTLYCNDCKIFICNDCLKQSHNEHSYEKIKEKWKKEKNNLKFNYQENIDDLINDSKEYLMKYSKKTINFINKIINDLNEIKKNIQNSIKKINEDNELILNLCEKMKEQMKLARNYPNNKIIESIKNLNFQDLKNEITYTNQNDNYIKDLKEEINNNISKFIIFKSNPKKENEDSNINISNNNLLNNNNNNNIFNNGNNTSLFGNNNKVNTLFSVKTNLFTITEERKIDPFDNLKKDLDQKVTDELFKKKNIISSKENSTSYNYLNSTFTSCQETRISDSEEDEIVYITNSGSCYHQEYCRYVKRSCIPIKLKDALKRGYKSCSRC